MGEHEIYVVVPYYNEESRILGTLDALANQSFKGFSVVLVDNGSTDSGPMISSDFAERHPELSINLISEEEKGTGAASDTGFLFAIQRGAKYIARTDADCIPDRDWVRNIMRAFLDEQLELVVGKLRPRTDETPLSKTERVMIPALLWIAENFGKLHRRGPQFKYRYIMVSGNNFAITASMYVQAGGLPRSKIEDRHEARDLTEKVRTITSKAKLKRDVVVYHSVRRLRNYGYLKTMLWYWDYKYRPDNVDVR